MDIDIAPLERANARLEEALQTYQDDTTQSLIRDGLVQRFEFTYEICLRVLRRYLVANAGPPELISGMSFADVIRVANENKLLLGNWPRWKIYRDMRARTSNSYDEAVALEVVAGIPAFLEEACYLRDQLWDRLSRSQKHPLTFRQQNGKSFWISCANTYRTGRSGRSDRARSGTAGRTPISILRSSPMRRCP